MTARLGDGTAEKHKCRQVEHPTRPWQCTEASGHSVGGGNRRNPSTEFAVGQYENHLSAPSLGPGIRDIRSSQTKRTDVGHYRGLPWLEGRASVRRPPTAGMHTRPIIPRHSPALHETEAFGLWACARIPRSLVTRDGCPRFSEGRQPLFPSPSCLPRRCRGNGGSRVPRRLFCRFVRRPWFADSLRAKTQQPQQ